MRMAASMLEGVCSTSGRTMSSVPPEGRLQSSLLGPRVDRRSRSLRGATVQSVGNRDSNAGSRNTACNSHSLAAELSVYQFPRKPEVLAWLESCVVDAVRHLDQAPFLQMVFGNQGWHIKRQSVPEAVVHIPQLWKGVTDYLSRSNPEVVVLVHKLNLGGSERIDDSMLLGRFPGVENILTGITTASPSRQQQRQSSSPHSVFSGKLGDCCDEEEAHPPKSDCHQHTDEYWGLVVQSKYKSSAEGCYVLKTSRSSSPDCHCTHYSLTRVSQGKDLPQQLASAWLI